MATVVGTIVSMIEVDVQVTTTVSPPTVLVSVTGQRDVIVLYTTDSVVAVSVGPGTVS